MDANAESKLQAFFRESVSYVLLVLALPAFIYSAYQMYYLTPSSGPQLLARVFPWNSGPISQALWWISAISFLTLGINALLTLLLLRGRKLAFTSGYIQLIVNIIQIETIHLFLYFSYYQWANLLFGN